MERFGSALIAGIIFTSASAYTHASIVWLAGQDVPIPTNRQGVVIDLQTGTSTAGDDALGADVNFFFGGFGIGNDADASALLPSFQPVRLDTDILSTVARLSAGTPVSGASTFATGFGGSDTHIPGEFTSGIPGYLGFSLETGTGTIFGWMSVTLTDNSAPGVVHGWAYEDSGAPIEVGAIPEPTTSLLGLLTLTGLALRRRR